jgi:hypothetical protein
MREIGENLNEICADFFVGLLGIKRNMQEGGLRQRYNRN